MNVPESEAIRGYWFGGEMLPHGDGRPVVVGETHEAKGRIECCRRGLHSSRHPSDALKYAPTPTLYLVESWGEVAECSDKLAASHRRYLAKIDASKLLRDHARWCARRVVKNWETEVPLVVLLWLRTGSEKYRSAAYSAADIAAEDAACRAADIAAEDAARSAASIAAEDAARSAAYYAASSAAYRAAYYAASSAACRAADIAAAEDAARNGDRSAASSAACRAADIAAAEDAARNGDRNAASSVAYRAEREMQRADLLRRVKKAFNEVME